MSDRTDIRPADRAATLLRSAVLMAALAAILVVAYGLMLPLPAGWSEWRPPILIAAAGGLALMLAWPSRRTATRARTADGVALVLGTASLVLGIGAVTLIGFGVALEIEARTRPQTLIYRMTDPSAQAEFLMVAGSVAALGGLGLWVARRRGRATGRVFAAGVAGRFSTVGLGVAGLIAGAVGAAAIYRWLMWG